MGVYCTVEVEENEDKETERGYALEDIDITVEAEEYYEEICGNDKIVEVQIINIDDVADREHNSVVCR